MTDDDRVPEQDPAGEPTTALPAPDLTPTAAFPATVGEPTTALPGPDTTPTTLLPEESPPPGPSDRGVDAQATALSAESGAGAGATTGLLPHPRIAPYVQAARTRLADLPASERSELLDDLDAHLHEILVEEGEAFEARLGDPDEYAAEFRASAGYPPADAHAESARTRPSRIRRLGQRTATLWGSVGDTLVERLHGLPGGPALLALLPRLRPAWWVFRAWLVAAVFGVDWPTGGYLQTSWWGALFWQLLLVAASVAWGLRTERRGHQGPGRGRRLERVGLGALNTFAVACCALAVLGAGPLVRSTDVLYTEPTAYPVADAPSDLWLNGAPVTNLVAYDLAGNPIGGFQLFTQDGDPVTVDEAYVYSPDEGSNYPVPVTTSNGTPVTNVYPIRRVDLSEPDQYYCDDADVDGECEPYAMSTLRAQRPAPAGSPWKDLTVTPVPAVGSTVPFGRDWQPVWSGVVPPQAANAPSPAPSPAASVGPSASPTAGADEPTPSPSASAKAKKGDEKPAKASDEG